MIPAPPPSVIAYADCSTFHIEIANRGGEPVYVGEGSQPPMSFSGSSVTIPIGLYERTHSFEAIVDIGNVRYYDQFVDCTSLAASAPAIPAPAQVASPAPPATSGGHRRPRPRLLRWGVS